MSSCHTTAQPRKPRPLYGLREHQIELPAFDEFRPPEFEEVLATILPAVAWVELRNEVAL